jgi:NADH-quinone oxidoreductase subunit J
MVNVDAWAYPALLSFLLGLVLVWMIGSDYTPAGALLGKEVLVQKQWVKRYLLTIYYWLKLPQCYCLQHLLQHSIWQT